MNHRISEPTLQLMSNTLDLRGKLTSLQFSSLQMKRFYYIKSEPELGNRGNHAHKLLTQIMFSISGTWSVSLTSNGATKEYQLVEDSNCLIIPPGYWRVFKSLSTNSILGVLADEIYDESDYIRDFQEFEVWEKNN